MNSRRYLICLIVTIFSSNGHISAQESLPADYSVIEDERTPSEVLRDSQITAAVKTKLLANPEVSGLSINVETFKREVTLNGIVNSEWEKNQALILAESIDGVEKVNSKLSLE